MEQLIKGAIARGLSRAQSYELWYRATELKKLKVFRSLCSLSRTGSSWSEIESLVRKYQLSAEQYQTLKRNYFSYVP